MAVVSLMLLMLLLLVFVVVFSVVPAMKSHVPIESWDILKFPRTNTTFYHVLIEI